MQLLFHTLLLTSLPLIHWRLQRHCCCTGFNAWLMCRTCCAWSLSLRQQLITAASANDNTTCLGLWGHAAYDTIIIPASIWYAGCMSRPPCMSRAQSAALFFFALE